MVQRVKTCYFKLYTDYIFMFLLSAKTYSYFKAFTGLALAALRV